MLEADAKKKWCPMANGKKSMAVLATLIPSMVDGTAGVTKAIELMASEESSRRLNGMECCLGTGCVWWVVDYNDGNGFGHCGGTKQ